jgi:hypothetical protein
VIEWTTLIGVNNEFHKTPKHFFPARISPSNLLNCNAKHQCTRTLLKKFVR